MYTLPHVSQLQLPLGNSPASQFLQIQIRMIKLIFQVTLSHMRKFWRADLTYKYSGNVKYKQIARTEGIHCCFDFYPLKIKMKHRNKREVRRELNRAHCGPGKPQNILPQTSIQQGPKAQRALVSVFRSSPDSRRSLACTFLQSSQCPDMPSCISPDRACMSHTQQIHLCQERAAEIFSGTFWEWE